MTNPSPALAPPASASRLPALGAASALAAFGLVQLAAYVIAGVFEYPLDDVYIHLAMAEGMAQGTYGVNPGEAASAASSILYPVLLIPFAGSDLQRFLPLFWNGAAVTLCGMLWGRALAEGGFAGRLAVALAVLGPVALNMAGVAFLGMEHSLHTALSLATVLGLWRFLNGGGIRPWFVLAVVLSPLFRLEGLALSLAAAGLVALRGRAGAGLALAAAVIAPVLAFAAGLMALGLPPLPSSVLVKLADRLPDVGIVEAVALRVGINASKPGGLLLAVLLVAGAIAARRLGAAHQAAARWLLSALAAAGLAHLVLGQIGWLHRYESYIIVVLVVGLVLATSRAGAAFRTLTLTAIAGAVMVWLPAMLSSYLWNPRAIHLQQAQMARFAQDYLREPVAVNDLGRVVWRNPNPVLDLWGLASERARHARLDQRPGPAGWAGRLVADSCVRLAMIYDGWIGQGIGAGWVKLAALSMRDRRGEIGAWVVSFHATDPAHVPALRAGLADFAATLPAGSILTLEGAR